MKRNEPNKARAAVALVFVFAFLMAVLGICLGLALHAGTTKADATVTIADLNSGRIPDGTVIAVSGYLLDVDVSDSGFIFAICDNEAQEVYDHDHCMHVFWSYEDVWKSKNAAMPRKGQRVTFHGIWHAPQQAPSKTT